MPDANGWLNYTVEVRGRAHRWHFCAGLPRDTLVGDTAIEKRQHLRQCRAAAVEAAEKAVRDRKAERDALRRLQAKEKRLEERILGGRR